MDMNGQFHPSAALALGKELPVSNGSEAGRASELVWTRGRREKNPFPAPAEDRRACSQVPVLTGLQVKLYFSTVKYISVWYYFGVVYKQSLRKSVSFLYT
jgi:hypothetical protein